MSRVPACHVPPGARKLHQVVAGDSEEEQAGALEHKLSPDRDLGLGCGLNAYRGTAWMGTLCKIVGGSESGHRTIAMTSPAASAGLRMATNDAIVETDKQGGVRIDCGECT